MPLIPQFGLVELLDILAAAVPGVLAVFLAAAGVSRLAGRIRRPGIHSSARAASRARAR